MSISAATDHRSSRSRQTAAHSPSGGRWSRSRSVSLSGILVVSRNPEHCVHRRTPTQPSADGQERFDETLNPNVTASITFDVAALADDPDGPASGLRIELDNTSANLGGGHGGTITAALSSDGRQVAITRRQPCQRPRGDLLPRRRRARRVRAGKPSIQRPGEPTPVGDAWQPRRLLSDPTRTAPSITSGLRPGRQHRQRV